MQSCNLADVLRELLPDNGFVIAYANGNPARIVFTGTGFAAPKFQPGFEGDYPSPGNGFVDPNTGMPGSGFVDPNTGMP